MKIGKREVSIIGYKFEKGTISSHNQILLIITDDTDIYMTPELDYLGAIGEIQFRDSEDVNVSFSVNNDDYNENGDEKLNILAKVAERLSEEKLEIIPTVLSHTFFSKCKNSYIKALRNIIDEEIELEEGDEFTFDPEALIPINEFRYVEFITDRKSSKCNKPKKRVKVPTK